MFSVGFKPGKIVNRDGTVCEATQLRCKVTARTSRLEALGIGSRDRVLICHGGTDQFFADLFAIWSVGACAICVNPGSSKHELENIAKFVSPKLVLTDERRAAIEISDSSPVESFVRIDGATETGDWRFRHPVDSKSEALILFTSGTTGNPKGVVHTYRSVMSRISTNRAYIGDQILKNSLCLLPTHFGHGLLGSCLTPLYAGGDLFLNPLTSIGEFANVGEKIDSYQITFFSSVPSMWRVMLKLSKPPSERTLRQVNIGSEQVSARLWNEAIKWTGTRNVVSMYGITETANWIGGISAQEHTPQDGLVGRVWDGNAAVRSESGTISTMGEGEILVKTPSLMSGYLNRPEETSSVMVDGYFATGDIGVVDPTGVITITGRKKLEINRGGIKVSPEEIEALIERHDTVAEVCVFGIPHEVSGETVAAAVVLRGQLSGDNHADSNSGINDLKMSLRQTVIPEKIPEKWYILEEIPKTDRGKIDRARTISDCL